jgi:hypothetical protein
MTRQIFVGMALICTAIPCALAGSALGDWIAADFGQFATVASPISVLSDAPVRTEHGGHSLEKPNDAFDEPAVDFYGNEVSDALATYSIDPRGDAVGQHSPQTLVVRLAPPKG